MPDVQREFYVAENNSFTVFAGSAIKQGRHVGRIDHWSEWNPIGNVKPRWLLLSGASNPPQITKISERRPRSAVGDRSGEFLGGVTHDLANMEKAVGNCLYNTVKDLYLKKSDALDKIRRLFHDCKQKGVKPMLYYTGHGEVGTGNWCFDDGTIGIQEILDMLPEGVLYPMIFSDACFSGHWANFCLNRKIKSFRCLAACPDYSAAIDTKDKGGDLTLFMTGKKSRPLTEPVYSGGNHKDYPLDSMIDRHTYSNLIRGLTQNTNRIVIAQTIYDGQLSVCLATSKVYSERSRGWGIKGSFATFMKFVRKQWEGKADGEPRRIFSLAYEKNLGFGVFLIGNYGTQQKVLRGTTDISANLKGGFKITACAGMVSDFCVIMTKGTMEYEDKQQTWFTCDSLRNARSMIDTESKEGKMVTAICYSTQKKYFLVMTEIPEEHCYLWFYDSKPGHDTKNEWYKEKVKEGFRSTLIFRHPTNATSNMFLLVMTKNQDIPINETFRYNLKLK